MICELYLKDNMHSECIDFINRIIKVFPKDQDQYQLIAEKMTDVPLEITSKYGLCCNKIGKKELANLVFGILMRDDINTYSDLFEEAAKSYEQLEDYQEALQIYERLAELAEYSTPEILLKIGQLYQKINNQRAAEKAFNRVIEKDPENYEAKVYLSEIYVGEGKMKDALEILGGGEYQEEEEGIFLEDEEGAGNDDVFLSDDENGAKAPKKPAETTIKKFKRPFLPTKYDETYKVSKHEKGSRKITRPQTSYQAIPAPKPFKLSKESIETRLTEIQAKYPIDHLILKFKQASILLENKQEKGFLDIITDALIQSLNLEIEIQDIRSKILNRFLYESQKKSFKRRIESGMEFESGEIEQNVLLKTKKTKIPNDTLQKRKAKYSNYLTEKQFEHVKTMSKELGKFAYYNTSLRVSEIFYVNSYLK